MNIAFGVVSKHSLQNPKSHRIFPNFLLENFIVLDFIFSSIVYFELNFICSMRYVLKFIFLQMNIQLFQYHLLKHLYFLH